MAPASFGCWWVEIDVQCTVLWREAHFEVKRRKTPQCRSTFGSWGVEKVFAVVVRSSFRSQKVQSTPRSEHSWILKTCTALWREAHFKVNLFKKNTTCSDHFWKLRYPKGAGRCGAKHMSKSNGCSRHDNNNYSYNNNYNYTTLYTLKLQPHLQLHYATLLYTRIH